MAENLLNRQFEFADTSFANLMSKRIYNILLYATKYDTFILEDDGRIDEQIFNEYTSLNLRYAPRFTQVSTEAEALSALSQNHYELIIYMPNLDEEDILQAMMRIKSVHPSIPFVVLAPFSRELMKRVPKEKLAFVDYVFSWLGNSELLLAIIKVMEDAVNVEHDTAEVGVQVILLVEDSVRFYSSALPTLYRLVLEESMNFSKEALNDHQQMLRKRGRPKILLARTYEEAFALYNRYKENMLGVITDMRFPRNGESDKLAGFKLASYIKEQDKHLPVIIASSESKNQLYADQLGFCFLDKNSKSFPLDLRNQVRNQFCLGDLVIINPKTKEQILKITNLRDLQYKLKDIPEDSLRYHMAQNHFSRFCNSRAIFPVGLLLKNLDIDNFEVDEARKIIEEAVAQYRKMKNSGIVAVFEKDRYDEWSNFARIGNGSLGGKGRGLAFMGHLVKMHGKLNIYTNFPVMIPKTVVLCTDIFDEFMETNHLYSVALSESDDEKILSFFLKAKLPDRLVEDFMTFLETIKNPIAIRSSSMLEDSHYQPFAGIYSTYMIPYLADKYETLRMLSESIKAVYASVFFKESKAYMAATKNLIDQEKMAVVLQELVGSTHGAHFYPTISGVARSLNFYPIGSEKTEDGVVNLALGLGKYIVDGGVTLRFSPACPKQILQMSSVEMALKETQKHFYALDVDKIAANFSIDDAFNLAKLTLKDADKEGELRFVASTFDVDDHLIRDGYYPGGRKIVSFANILQHELFPLSEALRKVLQIGQQEMGRPVEIEFAVNIEDKENAKFFLLQIRPIVDNKLSVNASISLVDKTSVILYCNSALGHGVNQELHDVVYVRTETFNASNNKQIAAEIEQVNQSFVQDGKEYVLIGPGRWGSSDPWLGIPVKWPFISQAQMVVELGLENYRVEPSQGTHFFQNLTSFGVGYFTVNPYLNSGDIFDLEFLNSQKAVYESDFLRHVRFRFPLTVKIDGRKSIGVIEKPKFM
jgi:CheY-like chemotaxis protein